MADAVSAHVGPETDWEAAAGTTAVWVCDVSQTDERNARTAAERLRTGRTQRVVSGVRCGPDRCSLAGV